MTSPSTTAEDPRLAKLRQALSDKYDITQKVGAGGMADVYLGVHRVLRSRVAVKVLLESFSRDQEMVARFKREAEAAAKLSHPNIITVYDFGEVEDLTYFVMRYVSGEDLRLRLNREKPLPLSEAIEITFQIARALDYSHRLGIIHRDIKPSNIMIDEFGTVLVTDFGIARMLENTTKLTVAGVTMGTPAYMSPEQVRGESADARSDLYSLGVILYELLSGQLPFTGESAYTIGFKHVYEPHRPVTELRQDIPPEMSEVVDKLLKKSPAERFQTAAEFLQHLNTLRVQWMTAAHTAVRGAALGLGGTSAGTAVQIHRDDWQSISSRLAPLDALLKRQAIAEDKLSSLNSQEAAILPLIDGHSSILRIIEACKLDRCETGRLILELIEKGVLYRENPTPPSTLLASAVEAETRVEPARPFSGEQKTPAAPPTPGAAPVIEVPLNKGVAEAAQPSVPAVGKEKKTSGSRRLVAAGAIVVIAVAAFFVIPKLTRRSTSLEPSTTAGTGAPKSETASQAAPSTAASPAVPPPADSQTLSPSEQAAAAAKLNFKFSGSAYDFDLFDGRTKIAHLTAAHRRFDLPAGSHDLRLVNRSIFLNWSLENNEFAANQSYELALPDLASATLEVVGNAYQSCTVSIDEGGLPPPYPAQIPKLAAGSHRITFNWTGGKWQGVKISKTVAVKGRAILLVRANPAAKEIQVQTLN